MELGQKLRQARIDAGLSQRQLCGEEITRNMLSLIENGSAKPSMKTLQYLSARLGKSVSYFLEETAVLSPNQELMISVRELYDAGSFPEAARMLKNYRYPDVIYDREKELLWILIRLELAREAIRQERYVYARELLNETSTESRYLREELSRKKLLLLGSIPQHQVAGQLPSMDTELMIRAEEAFSEGMTQRCCRLLEAMENQSGPYWHLLRGKADLQMQHWNAAIAHFHLSESALPEESFPHLEICYRETGNFQKAYEYACKQR